MCVWGGRSRERRGEGGRERERGSKSEGGREVGRGEREGARAKGEDKYGNEIHVLM